MCDKEFSSTFEGTKGVGFGESNTQNLTDAQFVNLDTSTPTNECKQELSVSGTTLVDDNCHICSKASAGYEYKGLCNGDQGSPLSDLNGYVIGVGDIENSQCTTSGKTWSAYIPLKEICPKLIECCETGKLELCTSFFFKKTDIENIVLSVYMILLHQRQI